MYADHPSSNCVEAHSLSKPCWDDVIQLLQVQLDYSDHMIYFGPGGRLLLILSKEEDRRGLKPEREATFLLNDTKKVFFRT